MNVHCAPACFTCHMLDFKSRCPYDAEAPTFLQEPGDLDKLFERIVTDPELAVFQPRAIVRPNATGESEDEGPWIVVLDNFLSEDECDVLIRLGGELGYERSMDVGEKLFDGSYGSVESKDRTSSNAWCVDKCWEDDVNTRVHDRLEKLTGIDRMNYEYLQLLSYEEGEFYGQHHDFIDYQVNRPQGVRVSSRAYLRRVVPTCI
jgi:prolyl 4-hydroxylase